jgi:hypothetical protein
LEDEIIKKDQVKKMFQRKKKLQEKKKEWVLNHLEKKIEIGWNHKKPSIQKIILKKIETKSDK